MQARAKPTRTSANLVKGNILQQAGSAVLAQANQQPDIVLSLLRAA
jgi:flagellin